MKTPPEDGCLEEITSSGLDHKINVIIIRRPDKMKKPGETTYTFATLDRTKEGEKWPGDKVLDELIPELPKVKSPEKSKVPEATDKTSTLLRHRDRKKINQKPVQKDRHFTSHRPRYHYKKFRSERPAHPSYINNIEPWVHKPWENQTFFPGLNTANSASATSLISDVSFNNFPSQPYPITSNAHNFSNNIGYERNFRPTRTSNTPFVNNHLKHENRSQVTNRMTCGPPPSFPPPIRYRWPQIRKLCGTAPPPNLDLNASTQNGGMLSESPTAGYTVRQGLLGDRPVPNVPLNQNLTMYSNNMQAQSNLQGDNVTSLCRDEENIGDQNNFISRPNFDKYSDVNGISGPKSQNFYEHSNHAEDSRNDSFRDTSTTNYNRFQNPINSVNNYKNRYRHNYNHLDHNYPNNSKNVPLKNSKDLHKTNYGKYERSSVGVNSYKMDNTEAACNNLCKNDYIESQTPSISGTTFIKNQDQNLESSVIHLNASTVVYNQEDFQTNVYSVSTNSSMPRSNLNSLPRRNKRSIHSKNMLSPKRNWTTNKFANYRSNKGKYNQGHQKFKNWRRPRR